MKARRQSLAQVHCKQVQVRKLALVHDKRVQVRELAPAHDKQVLALELAPAPNRARLQACEYNPVRDIPAHDKKVHYKSPRYKQALVRCKFRAAPGLLHNTRGVVKKKNYYRGLR